MILSNAPALSGRVDRFESRLMTLLLDAPTRGIGVVGAESFAGTGFPTVYLFDGSAEEMHVSGARAAVDLSLLFPMPPVVVAVAALHLMAARGGTPEKGPLRLHS